MIISRFMYSSNSLKWSGIHCISEIVVPELLENSSFIISENIWFRDDGISP
jgi:hypothetical protein